ncbi:hypothetical protein [Teichococcus rhizosphaerae]|uniref:hypothetical protein n=1 Tax=Teichococcus rhizosphaerae TaxID=1335062 RepID=UPI0011454591|nr:hypothetical protein [Pseudoroseomonas rhizosphaerae]
MMGFMSGLSLKTILTCFAGLILTGGLGLAVWSYTATRAENADLHEQVASLKAARDQAIEASKATIETHQRVVAQMEAAAAKTNEVLQAERADRTAVEADLKAIRHANARRQDAEARPPSPEFVAAFGRLRLQLGAGDGAPVGGDAAPVAEPSGGVQVP